MDRPTSSLRRDAHHGGWVLVSSQPEREQLLALARQDWPLNAPNALCDPDAAGALVIWHAVQALPDGRQGVVRVIANRYPLYQVEGQEEKIGLGMYDQMRGIGAHEIIIESQKHEDTLLTIHPQHYVLTLCAMQDRIRDLRNDIRLRTISVFREWTCDNKDRHLHAHSQLIASAALPLGYSNELESSRQYYNYKERCLFCDMIRQEKNENSRIVSSTDEYVAFCPFASRYPFEVHLFPIRHCHDYVMEPREHFASLAMMIRDVAARLEKAIPGWTVVMVMHSSPTFPSRLHVRRTIQQDYHWHIEFLPQPPGYIDWFIRTGAHVEHTVPEKAAAYLRSVEVPSPWS